ncbi:receptor-like protein 37 [Hevea brasiliensis]|uniref:receptor-like protein 37 n=1 Tax=Hevea brasiliensis TaxID=3981 RepID=UPI0025CEB5DB|nr:receptor-like protein 37 [Hevea brasiliensis]
MAKQLTGMQHTPKAMPARAIEAAEDVKCASTRGRVERRQELVPALMGSATATVVEILAILILLQSVLFCCNRANVNGSCIKIEREALIKIKASHGINSSYSLLSWVGDNCCRWEGVTCDNILDLYLNQDRKLTIDSLHFPPSLKYLKMEGVLLDKCDNCLQSINMLPALLELSMSNCELSLTGHVSHVNLTSLQVLDLSYNNFNSTIPSWLFNISNLQHLDLSYNAFQGSLSTEIGNLNSLAFLDLSYNSLEGNIPKTLNKLCNLSELLLESNKFSASILDISNNLLHGQIPRKISKTMPNLELLFLSNNYLNGTIPASLCSLGRLEILHLSTNHLSGRIPSCWGNLTYLRVIDLSNNMLRGRVPMSLAAQSLVSLHLQNNNLQGKILMSLRHLESLETLDLSMNAFDGFIPSWIGENLSKYSVFTPINLKVRFLCSFAFLLLFTY